MTTETAAPKFSLSTSDTIGAIAKALAAAQLEMGPAIKDRVGRIPGKDGKAGYEYRYATLATCFEAIQPLHKNGIAVTQIPIGCDNGVLVATLLIHESGEWIRGEMWMPVTQQTPQGYGSALTYARRYGLTALCGLASDDDDGEAASQGQQKPSARQSRAPAPSPAPTTREVDPKVFQALCDRVDQAETVAAVNTVAVGAKKAGDEGAISRDQLEAIKRAVTNKRTLLGGQSNANGATQ